MKKLFSVADAVRLIPDGCILGIGGNVLHRAPMALIHEIVRQGKKQLCIVKTAGALDVDMLCLGSCVKDAHIGSVEYETMGVQAVHYNGALKSGALKQRGHTYATVIASLRAARLGLPFMPVKGNPPISEESEYLSRTTDPFTGEEITVARAIVPDVCILHVHEADVFGNAVLYPPLYEDLLLANAARTVIISAEKVSPDPLETHKNDAGVISHFLVQAVVPAPGGAAPCSCHPYYDVDQKSIEDFLSIKEQDDLHKWLKKFENT